MAARRVGRSGYYAVWAGKEGGLSVLDRCDGSIKRGGSRLVLTRFMHLYVQALRCHRWINRVDYMMSTAAYLLDPGFKVCVSVLFALLPLPGI